MVKQKLDFGFEISDLKLLLRDAEFEKITLSNNLHKTESKLEDTQKEVKELVKKLSQKEKILLKQASELEKINDMYT